MRLLLDAFCCAGGAGKGYADAGFTVVGVDKDPQPRYPFEFHQGDALEVADSLLAGGRLGEHVLADFSAWHGSPPCQHFSSITIVTGRREDHPDLLEPTRMRFKASGLPYVIENVVRAPLHDPVTLCGVAFNLTIVEDGVRYVLRRHRKFETNFPLMVPPCACRSSAGTTLGIYGGGTRQDTRKEANPGGGNTQKANRAQAQALMRMPWATRQEMNQAIPPVYTEHIGGYLMAEIDRRELELAA